KSIMLNNEGVDKYALAAWLLWSTGKHDEAIGYYNKMILANPNNPDAYFEYGFYYVTQKNDKEAVRWLQTAVALGLKSPKRHLYGHALKRLGMKEEALAFWKKVLVEEPGNEVARNEVEKLLNPDVVKTGETPTAVPPLDTTATATILYPTIVPTAPKNNVVEPAPAPTTNIKDPVMNK
ncbi:MAG: tetratricopeptide repeat protein, partial [bacterium]